MLLLFISVCCLFTWVCFSLWSYISERPCLLVSSGGCKKVSRNLPTDPAMAGYQCLALPLSLLLRHMPFFSFLSVFFHGPHAGFVLLICSEQHMIWCSSTGRRQITCGLMGAMVPCPSQSTAEVRLDQYRSWSISLIKIGSHLGFRSSVGWHPLLAPIIGFGEGSDLTDSTPGLPVLIVG